jgi:hypothetical protein
VGPAQVIGVSPNFARTSQPASPERQRPPGFCLDRQQLKGLALKRWYELDPEGADREIVAQIGSATPSLAAQSIAFLPQEHFPQFELIWAQALLDTTSQLRERALGSLLVRFGTGFVTSRCLPSWMKRAAIPAMPIS